jgi:hypothetical protein
VHDILHLNAQFDQNGIDVCPSHGGLLEIVVLRAWIKLAGSICSPLGADVGNFTVLGDDRDSAEEILVWRRPGGCVVMVWRRHSGVLERERGGKEVRER